MPDAALPYLEEVWSNRSSLSGADALATLLLSTALYFLVGPLLAGLGRGGLALAQVLAFALPALLVALTRPLGTQALGLHNTSKGVYLGSLLIALSLWYWNLLVIAPIGADWGNLERLQEFGDALAVEQNPLWQSILLFAAVPAVCEELLHRGVVLPSLRARIGGWPAIVVGAFFFAATHLSLARLLPTAALGLFAGFLRLRSGSLAPAILLHFGYNASLLVIARVQPPLPGNLTILALAISLIGVVFVHKYSKSNTIPNSNG